MNHNQSASSERSCKKLTQQWNPRTRANSIPISAIVTRTYAWCEKETMLVMHFATPNKQIQGSRNAYFWRTMSAGTTHLSNCSSVTKPSCTADCLSVSPCLCAFFAILAALS